MEIIHQGYFLEIERYLAAAKLNMYFMDEGNSEETKEAINNLERAGIALRDLIEELR